MKSKHPSNRNVPKPQHPRLPINRPAAAQTLPAVEGIERGNAATEKQTDHHSQPLADQLIRKLASAEQAKLQRDPDALPGTGYPSRRPALSPAGNPNDAKAIPPPKVRKAN